MPVSISTYLQISVPPLVDVSECISVFLQQCRPAKPTVLITGATGYIGSYILHQLLGAGYPVRATARPSKVDALKESFKGRVDVVPLADLVTGDYSEALKGIGAIIHVASPLPGTEDAASMINNAVEGTMNILRQATAAGTGRIVITSSVSTLYDFDMSEPKFYSDIVLTDKDWTRATVDDALSGGCEPWWVYYVAKTTSDRAVRKFESEHPEIDITTIHPPFVYGPMVPGAKVSKEYKTSISSFNLFWNEVLPEGGSSVTIDRIPQAVPAITVDVRDVARAHVLALTAPLTSEVGRKRLIVAGPSMSWIDAVAHLRKVMPELEDRLPRIAEGAAEKEPLQVMTFDVSRTEEVLGLGGYIDWRKTAEDTAKCILEIEKSWEAAS